MLQRLMLSRVAKETSELTVLGDGLCWVNERRDIPERLGHSGISDVSQLAKWIAAFPGSDTVTTK